MILSGTKVGWIGAGKMGFPMSRCLIKNGAEIHVADPDESQIKKLVNEGAQAGSTNISVASESDIVISMIPNDAVLRDVVFGESGIFSVMKSNSVYVDMSTVSPEVSEEVSNEANNRGICYLRAPVSGSTLLAESGNLTIICSGNKEAFTKCLPLFEVMGAKQYYVGSEQQALYLKLAINLLAGSTIVALAESLAFGRKGGLDWDLMLDVMNESVIASPLLKYTLPPLKERNFQPAFAANQMNKDLGLICDAAANIGAPSDISQIVRDIYMATIASGHGSENLTAVVKEIERKAELGEP
jgi:3-hydroxyisobutyrate dehydrogenase-like beta-hydroxyacid dehydrogenase